MATLDRTRRRLLLGADGRGLDQVLATHSDVIVNYHREAYRSISSATVSGWSSMRKCTPPGINPLSTLVNPCVRRSLAIFGTIFAKNERSPEPTNTGTSFRSSCVALNCPFVANARYISKAAWSCSGVA